MNMSKGFNWECIKVLMIVNPDELSMEPLNTFKWTPTLFHLNPKSPLKWALGLIVRIQETKQKKYI